MQAVKSLHHCNKEHDDSLPDRLMWAPCLCDSVMLGGTFKNKCYVCGAQTLSGWIIMGVTARTSDVEVFEAR